MKVEVEGAQKRNIGLSELKDEDLESTLVISEFLTRFYPHFRRGDDEVIHDGNETITGEVEAQGKGKVIISPLDIISAIKYRNDVERYRNFSSIIKDLKKPGFYGSSKKDRDQDKKLDEFLAKEGNKVWKRMQERITQGRMSADEDVIDVLTMLEVRLAKAISNDTLLNKVSEKDKSSNHYHPSCSTLLGIPSGNYFSSILPQCIYDATTLEKEEEALEQIGNVSERMGTLAVPANSLTWKELLRISKVVGSLPTKEALQSCKKSTLTQTVMIHTDGFDPKSSKPNLMSSRKESNNQSSDTMLLMPNSKMRGTDLVALWVRAQRNTGAFMQLLALFDLVEIENDVRGSLQSAAKEVIDVDVIDGSLDQKEKGIPNEISFVPDPEIGSDHYPIFSVSYVGNPNKMRHRVEREAPMLDKLVEWTIVNQVFFTQKYMKALISNPQGKKGNTSASGSKRGINEVSNGSSEFQSNTKRQKEPDESIMPPELKNAYQSYILKWFGQRNREALRIIFSSSDLSQEEDTRAVEQIKKILKSDFDSTDRTFARINRRILLSKYQTFDAFQVAVKRLLDALKTSMSKDQIQMENIERAKVDFTCICKSFLPHEEHNCGKLICPLTELKDCEIPENLCAHPRPWFDEKEKCRRCEDSVLSEKMCKTCWNCNSRVHLSCIDSESGDISPFGLEKYKYISAVLMSAQDLPEDSPDFVANPIEWERVELVMKRSHINGKLPPWCLTLQHTEHCDELLLKCIDNVLDPRRWDGVEESEKIKKVNPMRVPHSGMIIDKISEGPGKRAGLHKGDVIVEIDVLNTGKNNGNNVFSNREKFILKDIRDADLRKNVFRIQSSEMKLVVMRPSVSITEMASSYKRTIEHAQARVDKAFQSLVEKRWYCSECRDENNEKSQESIESVRICQWVIRRLGMEECSIPFHSETPNADEVLEGGGIRNDGIVEIDLASSDSENLNSFQPDQLEHASLRRLDEMMHSLSNEDEPTSFYTPPWTKKRKLKWASSSSSNPFRLLCAGIVVLLKKAQKDGIEESERTEFAKRFVQLLISWCLDYRGECGARLTKGPPDCARFAITPWLLQSCSVCKVSAVKDMSSLLCTHCFLKQTNNGPSAEVEFEGTERHKKSLDEGVELPSDFETHNPTLQYEMLSSYVGTVLLAPINDTLVMSVLDKAKININEGRRCIEMIVISYVPSRFLNEKNMDGLVYEKGSDFKDRWANANGLFFLLPIMSSAQMQFIQTFCTIWESEVPSESPLLKLPGIIALIPSEFYTRLRMTHSMVSSVDRAVQSLSSKFGDSIFPMMVHDISKSENYPSKLIGLDNSDAVQLLFGQKNKMPLKSMFTDAEGISYAIDVFTSNPVSCRKLINKGPHDFESVFEGISSSIRKLPKSQNPLSLLKFLDGMVSFDASAAAKQGHCNVFYSDLLFWTNLKKKNGSNTSQAVSMKLLGELVAKQDLYQPPSAKSKGRREIIVLHRQFSIQSAEDSDDEEYQPEGVGVEKEHVFSGVGWGFELVKWASENYALRVGRVAPNSPAADAGMRMHDIVQSINGNPISLGMDGYECASILLSENETYSIERCDRSPAVPFLYRHTHKRRPVYGPIVLEILRVNINPRPLPDDDEVILVEPSQQGKRARSHNVSHRNDQRRSSHQGRQQQLQVQHINYQEPASIPVPHNPSAHPSAHPPEHQTIHPPVHPPAHQPIHPPIHPPAQPPHYPPADPLPQPQYQLPGQLLPTQPMTSTPLMGNHLYMPSVNGSFLTLCETVVLLHAIKLNHLQLSTRLLSPRYPHQRVNEEYVTRIKPFVEEHGISSIPTLNEDMWNALLERDWHRMQKESGPVIFEEHGHAYRKPVERLPIDRFFEEFINRKQSERRQKSSATMRIRGGGEEHNPLRPQSLSIVPINEWAGKTVFGPHMKQHNDNTGQRGTLIGRIVSGAECGTSVIVEVIFISTNANTWLEPPQKISCPQQNLRFIPNSNHNDSNDDMLTKVKACLQYMKKTGNEKEFDESSDLQNASQKEELEPVTKKHLLLGAATLVEDLKESASSLLGVLPDRRIVHWFASDPSAIYLYHQGDSDKLSGTHSKRIIAGFEKSADFAKKNNSPFPFIECKGSKKFCCLWGCCVKGGNNSKERLILSFDTLDELKSHYSRCHRYTASQRQGDEQRSWTRISCPMSIKDLCADLTSHICGQATALSSFVKNHEQDEDSTEKEEDFYRSYLSKSITFDVPLFLHLHNGRPDFEFLRGICLIDSTLQKSILLWTRLVRLFDIESIGCYRLVDTNENRTQFNSKELELTADTDEGEIAVMKLDESVPSNNEDSICYRRTNLDLNVCLCGARQELDTAHTLNCHICRHQDEVILKSKKDSEYHGVGCTLVTDLCFPGVDTANRIKLHLALKGILPVIGEVDVIKVLLIKLAANIPSTLYAPVMSNSNQGLWRGELLDVWIDFITRCTSIRMTFQGFAALQYSLNKNRLPKWWKAKPCGYAGAPTCLNSPSVSNLSLLIFTLDRAVAEYISTARKPYEEKTSDAISAQVSSPTKTQQQAKGENWEENFNQMEIKERFKVLQSWAKTMGLPQFNDEWADDCVVCKNGGDLLCCEYCQNVAHQGCIGCEGDLEDIVFICSECTSDITNLRRNHLRPDE